jgi:hypothetical protein
MNIIKEALLNAAIGKAPEGSALASWAGGDAWEFARIFIDGEFSNFWKMKEVDKRMFLLIVSESL